MKTPRFWNNKNIVAFLLLPLSILYYLIYKLRCFVNFNPYKSKIPVICVGNIVAGGAGKTPTAIEIAKMLKQNNKTFCFLSKGYGGKFEGVVKLDNNSIAEVVGDEPLLLFEYGDVFVSKNRVKGLKYINNNCNYDYIIIDDGLQNPTFIKDKIVLVIDGKFGFGNGFILPAGALRDKFENIYKKVDVVILNNGNNKHIQDLCNKYNIKIIQSKIVADNVDDFKNKEYVAFCGLGRPEKFKNTLLENEIKLKDFIAFEDHYKYTDKDIEKLHELMYNPIPLIYEQDVIFGDMSMGEINITPYLITTKKDWVKLSNKNKQKTKYLDIHIELDNNELKKVLL